MRVDEIFKHSHRMKRLRELTPWVIFNSQNARIWLATTEKPGGAGVKTTNVHMHAYTHTGTVSLMRTSQFRLNCEDTVVRKFLKTCTSTLRIVFSPHLFVVLPRPPVQLMTTHFVSCLLVLILTSSKYSFYPRTTVDWNALPASVKSHPSIHSFRCAIHSSLTNSI